MSVVIAIKEKNKIVLGCDSQTTYGNIKSTLKGESTKIFEVKGLNKAYMGVVGSCRDSQLLSISDKIVDPLTSVTNSTDYEWVVKCLYHSIYTILLENNRIEKDVNGNWVNSTLNDYLFAHKDKAYFISGTDGAVIEIDDYLVAGSGSEVAIGVLENNKGKPAEERIREAIKACAEKTIYVDNNVVIRRT